MTEEFISVQDRILTSSIDIISDSGLGALNTKNIARYTGVDEAMLYKYYSNVDEVLVDVVEYYFRFDKGIFSTLASKDISNLEKVRRYLESYASYYSNYIALSSIMLQNEELLHNPATRDAVLEGVNYRNANIQAFFQGAIDDHEIRDDLSAETLTNLVHGFLASLIFNRRVRNHKRDIKFELLDCYDKTMSFIKAD